MNATMTAERRSEIAKKAQAARTPFQRHAAAIKAHMTRKYGAGKPIVVRANDVIESIRKEKKMTPSLIVVIRCQPEGIAINAKALVDTLKIMGGTVTITRRRDGLVVNQDGITSRFVTPTLTADSMKEAAYIDLKGVTHESQKVRTSKPGTHARAVASA